MAKNRIKLSLREKQHKPRREGATGKEMAGLKQENRNLRRKVARLEKELSKIDGSILDAKDLVDELTPFIATVETDLQSCKECGSASIITITTPSGKVRKSCKDCKTQII